MVTLHHFAWEFAHTKHSLCRNGGPLASAPLFPRRVFLTRPLSCEAELENGHFDQLLEVPRANFQYSVRSEYNFSLIVSVNPIISVQRRRFVVITTSTKHSTLLQSLLNLTCVVVF